MAAYGAKGHGSVVVDDPILLQGLPQQRPLKLMEYLEGTWLGEGVCEYPPHVPRFQYIQELIIEKAVPHSPKELHWSFRSVARHKDTNEGLHSEWGFLRFQPSAIDHGRLELTCTASNGLCEIDEGTFTEDSFDVWTRYGGLTRPQSSSRPYVTEVRRWCELRPQNTPITMEYRVEMATERSCMQPHLFSRLRKSES
mmetsp:Transcript_40033/g.87414  ORF Transcript_40033/g.87414 Transcript_40033/m.87414 type:complete len:197 (-) Transcript_40033:136-726(-)